MSQSTGKKSRRLSETPQNSRNPSQVTDEYWLYAYPAMAENEEISSKTGKWLIFVNIRNVNALWAKIQHATEAGELGVASKVATMKSKPYASDRDTKIICVYTYDWEDEPDVMRVRERLRDLGITGKIPYKSDQDTIEGKYATAGNKRISKYFA